MPVEAWLNVPLTVAVVLGPTSSRAAVGNTGGRERGSARSGGRPKLETCPSKSALNAAADRGRAAGPMRTMPLLETLAAASVERPRRRSSPRRGRRSQFASRCR